MANEFGKNSRYTDWDSMHREQQRRQMQNDLSRPQWEGGWGSSMYRETGIDLTFTPSQSLVERINNNVRKEINMDFIKTEVATVEEIHNAIDNIEETILAEAEKILGNATEKDAKEYLALQELGFGSLKPLAKINESDKWKKVVEESASLSGYYTDKYHKKFLSDDMVTFICKKYNLYLGNAKKFIGSIPADARKEILAFTSVDAGDIKTAPAVSRRHFTEGNVTNYSMVAPSTMFNLENSYVSPDNEIKDMPIDPIALYPVKDGYLVIAKWGAEEDINEIQ